MLEDGGSQRFKRNQRFFVVAPDHPNAGQANVGDDQEALEAKIQSTLESTVEVIPK